MYHNQNFRLGNPQYLTFSGHEGYTVMAKALAKHYSDTYSDTAYAQLNISDFPPASKISGN